MLSSQDYSKLMTALKLMSLNVGGTEFVSMKGVGELLSRWVSNSGDKLPATTTLSFNPKEGDTYSSDLTPEEVIKQFPKVIPDKKEKSTELNKTAVTAMVKGVIENMRKDGVIISGKKVKKIVSSMLAGKWTGDLDRVIDKALQGLK